MFYSNAIYSVFENYLFSIEVGCGEFAGPVVFFFLIPAVKNGNQKQKNGYNIWIAEYITETKSLYFLIQRNPSFYITFDCFPVCFLSQ